MMLCLGSQLWWLFRQSMVAIQVISTAQPLWIQEVINSYATDQQAQDLVAQLALVSPNEHGYSLHQGVVRKGSLIWIGNNSALKTKLIVEFHSSAMGGPLWLAGNLS
jgi:hypothetical protein